MKRKEAVQIISDRLEKLRFHTIIPEIDAHFILKDLEDAGIQPPKYLREYKPLPSKTAHVEMEGWEPEDETS